MLRKWKGLHVLNSQEVWVAYVCSAVPAPVHVVEFVSGVQFAVRRLALGHKPDLRHACWVLWVEKQLEVVLVCVTVENPGDCTLIS